MNVSCFLGVLWSGGALVLIGVVVGGFLVFRTKRDAYEPVFAKLQQPETSPVNLDDLAPPPQPPEEDVVPDLFGAKNREFLSQLTARHKEDTEEQEAVNVV